MKRLEDEPWWPELIAIKDGHSLRELADRFGASPAAIASALRRNGMSRKAAPAGPKRGPKGRARSTARGRRSVLDQYQDQIGHVVDREIAELAGVTVSAVTNYRRRHNIEASTSRGRPQARAEGTRGARSRNRPARGYRVVINGEAFVVIAADIAEAAEKAAAFGRGEVTQIELLGRALG